MKKNRLSEIDFYFITDSGLSKNIFNDAADALKAGCKIIQYREKNKNTEEMTEDALQLKKLCNNKAIFIVNDNADVAKKTGADGVHIGQDDVSYSTARKILGNNKIIGVTVHNLKEAIAAEKIGVDYIGLSPIFGTNTKKDAGKAVGVEMIKKVRKEIRIPIVAIGGINKKNVADVIKAGADSAAAISAVLCTGNVHKEILEFRKIINKNKKVS